MPEAHAEQRRSLVERPDQLDEASRILRPAGTRRQDHSVRRAGRELGAGGGIRTNDVDALPLCLDELDEVVDERVVVVDDQDHQTGVPDAASTAEAFASVSRSSAAASESKTIPAPACTWSSPADATAVRI